jgi:hypothetical protein
LSAAAQVLRILLNSGHGLSNVTPEVYDHGAKSQYGAEAAIVSRIVESVSDYYFLARNTETCSPATDITVLPTPVCNEACLSGHPRSGHLQYVITWVNQNCIRTKSGYGDVLLSIHMNSAESESATGTEVIVDNRAGAERYHEAQNISRIVAGVLGLPDRGAKTDRETPRKSIAIVEDTRPPAYLIELGFVTNPRDVQAVEACGAQAVIAAINAIARGK